MSSLVTISLAVDDDGKLRVRCLRPNCRWRVILTRSTPLSRIVSFANRHADDKHPEED